MVCYKPVGVLLQSGMPDFPWYNIPKWEKYTKLPQTIGTYVTAIKYTKRPQYRPNVHKIYQHLPLQDPPKFTQIGIFGLKICHLATLAAMGRVAQRLPPPPRA
jgi:hypothetical protein